MAIRLSGMVSGMDTDALVTALVSAYSVQKDNLVKAQTKLSWKQDSWKEMNTKIYSFYSGKLSSARMSKAYSLKSASISNSVYAKVTASSNAVTGTQSLVVEDLAATGYLTGGVISGKTDDGKNNAKLTGSSKLSDIAGTDITGGTITVTADGKTTDIALSGDMTINQFVAKLKDAGVNASFDENNQRFFISAKTSGKDNDFTMVANDGAGLTALKTMKLFTVNNKEKAEYTTWAGYADPAKADELEAVKEEAYNKVKISYESRAKQYADKYNAAKAIVDTMEGDGTLPDKGATLSESFDIAITETRDALNQKYADYATKDDNGDTVYDDDGNVVVDTAKLEEDGKLSEYNAEKAKLDALINNKSVYEKNLQIVADTSSYVSLDMDGKAVADAANANVVAEVDDENATIKAQSDAAIDAKVALAVDALKETSGAEGAVRIVGCDSKIILNGATFTSNTNDYSINGLTIQATAKTGAEAVNITTTADVDGIYDTIKDFFKEYNELIKAMDTAYNATSAKGYDPLTSEEKEAMTEDEIEKWEKKIKDSLLRKDTTLGNTSTALKNMMSMTIEIEGKKYSLASFGIKTQGYFDSGANEKGVYHIDGDKDDSVSSGNEDKLKAMIASDPEVVLKFFSELSTNVYQDLGKRMAATSMSSIYTIYNDKEMATQYSEYNTKISDKEDEITSWEDYYYDKFSRMESALASLNSQQSSLSGLLGM